MKYHDGYHTSIIRYQDPLDSYGGGLDTSLVNNWSLHFKVGTRKLGNGTLHFTQQTADMLSSNVMRKLIPMCIYYTLQFAPKGYHGQQASYFTFGSLSGFYKFVKFVTYCSNFLWGFLLHQGAMFHIHAALLFTKHVSFYNIYMINACLQSFFSEYTHQLCGDQT